MIYILMSTPMSSPQSMPYGAYSPKDALAFALACELTYAIKDEQKRRI